MGKAKAWTSKTLFVHFTALREADLRALEAALEAVKSGHASKQAMIMGVLALAATVIAGVTLFVR